VNLSSTPATGKTSGLPVTRAQFLEVPVKRLWRGHFDESRLFVQVALVRNLVIV